MATNSGKEKLNINSKLKLNSGYEIPHIGFGVYNLYGKEVTDSVVTALNDGYRLIDTAQLYGNESESGAGINEWLKKNNGKFNRNDVFYTTKIWDTNQGYEKAKKSIDESLKISGLEYIDLFLINSPYPGKTLRLETWKALEEAVEAGKVRSIGVSNYSVKHLKELEEVCKIPPAVNQLEIHPFLTRTEIIDYCQSKGIVVEAFCPLTRGERFGDSNIQALVKKYDKTPAQILLRWSLERGLVPLPKSAHPDRIKENINLFDFSITKDEVESLMSNEKFVIDWDPTNCD